MQVIDNFLEPENFKALQDNIFNPYFPWYVMPGVTEVKNENKDHWLLTHHFYKDYEVCSRFFKPLSDVIVKLDMRSIIRIKANLYPRTDKRIEHDFHSDYDYSHKSGLYSLNTNNGFTIMGDGKKIESVANRMIIFDASKPHKSTTCTDKNFRTNIVFNYF